MVTDSAGPNHLSLLMLYERIPGGCNTLLRNQALCLLLQHTYPTLFLFPTWCSVLYTNPKHPKLIAAAFCPYPDYFTLGNLIL